jgi:hypothetical protein
MGGYSRSHHPHAEKGIGSEWLVVMNVDALVDVAGGGGGGVGTSKHVASVSLYAS